jgi:hypothetical protein
MALRETLEIKKHHKQFEIHDLDSDKEIGISISDGDRAEQVIFLEVEDLIQIKAHIDYILNKANN